MLFDFFYAGMVAIGFAILFSSPKETLFFVFLTGGLGYEIRDFLIEKMFLGYEISTYFSAFAISVLGIVFAKLQKIPQSVYVISGSIVLVPGIYAYETMIAFIDFATSTLQNDTNMLKLLQNGSKTTLTLGAIAFGITTPSIIFRRYAFKLS
ncbi:MAG: threonine/serine exporter family protein [Campylobacterales bacterium]|nr:threonine/serine exporter family protein [Campylobacterales bacterium]